MLSGVLPGVKGSGGEEKGKFLVNEGQLAKFKQFAPKHAGRLDQLFRQAVTLENRGAKKELAAAYADIGDMLLREVRNGLNKVHEGQLNQLSALLGDKNGALRSDLEMMKGKYLMEVRDGICELVGEDAVNVVHRERGIEPRELSRGSDTIHDQARQNGRDEARRKDAQAYVQKRVREGKSFF
jgi:hypothetical protein